jgi:membrane protein
VSTDKARTGRRTETDDQRSADAADHQRRESTRSADDAPSPGYVAPDHPSKPGTPSDLTKPTWFGVLKRSAKEFSDDNCTDWAAALTYYGVLSMFPAAIVLVALVGLVSDGQQTVDAILGLMRDIGAGAAVEPLQGPIQEVVTQRQVAGPALVFGLLGALWTASGYIGAFTRVSNAIYEVEEGRPFYKLRPLQVLVTLVALVMVAIVAAGLVVSGPVAEWIGGKIGLGASLVTVWDFGKWPVLLLIITVLISLLYWVAPNVQQPRFRWFTVGGALALLTWILASAAFGVYLANFSSYNKTYGSLGAIISFLVWLYISNCAILLGAEINAELERGRELQADLPAEETLLLPPRQEPKTGDGT